MDENFELNEDEMFGFILRTSETEVSYEQVNAVLVAYSKYLQEKYIPKREGVTNEQ